MSEATLDPRGSAQEMLPRQNRSSKALLSLIPPPGPTAAGLAPGFWVGEEKNQLQGADGG